MCGRFTLTSSPGELARRFELDEPPELAPRYNIAPGQDVLALRVQTESRGSRSASPLHWGLIPHWASDRSIGYRTINARIETLHERAAFRDSLEARRCLIPANGFYEWAERAGVKAPYYIATSEQEPFAFAGLWARWRDPEERALESCTILTTDAHATLRDLHDRMPVIVDPRDYADWLDPDAPADEGLLDRLRDAADAGADSLCAYPVSFRVNSAQQDDAACIERVPEPPRQESLF